ncbi:SWIM zinc finger domain-containing protein [Rufibacter sp. XAAS-G3-1]|uniref:SWIM zinc finger family protein n=1 Tax=Rufibacter sp. XAAS-G3-1 TaxID=2729134 RepID=UPI0015E7C3A8|nr:SWIM zinc finger family protein [Rufibacter sp. XAAS-G3-1]
MLTLQNFETQTPPSILQRGQQYYSAQAVTMLEETDAQVWQAEVEGTELYQVELKLGKKGEVKEYFCDCPYDGDLCKHVVAVLYAVRAESKKPTKAPPTEKRGRNVFEHLLKTITVAEYQDFVRQYAAKNKGFKSDFELHFADKDDRIDVAKKYAEVLKKAIRQHSDPGYISYRGANGVAKEVGKLLAMGHQNITRQNFVDAFALAKAVLKEMLEVVKYADDSSGKLSDTLYDTTELLASIAQAPQAATDLKQEIYAFLLQELNHPDYFNYDDFGYELYDILSGLALLLQKSDEFLNYLDNQISRLTGRYDDYQKEFFLTRKVTFLASIGRPEEAEAQQQQHLEVVAIRKAQVEKAISNKEYAGAKKLLADGISLAESKGHPGTVMEWEKQLLRIAYLEQDTPTIRRLARQFAFDSWFNSDYYQQWKATFPPDEWEKTIEKYISDTIKEITQTWEKQKSGYWRPAHPPLLPKLGQVYIQEKYWDRLLALVQKENSLDATLAYHPYLAPHYPSELLRLYLPAFEAYGQKANGRSEYASLARKMEQVMENLPEGKEKIKAVAQRLKEQFPRRPAMLEELERVLKK